MRPRRSPEMDSGQAVALHWGGTRVDKLFGVIHIESRHDGDTGNDVGDGV